MRDRPPGRDDEASRRRPDLADQRRADIGVEATADTAATETRPIINLHRHPDEGIVELAGRVARERRIDLRAAVRLVSGAYPDRSRYERDVI